MEIRVLRPHEFDHLLSQTPLADIDPASAAVAAAINERGEVVGTLALVTIPHSQGAWVREDYRNGLVLSQLERMLESYAREHGISKRFAFGERSDTEGYLQRLGYTKTDWTVWVKEA